MNITTKTFPRRSGEQRPCDAQEAVAMQRCKDEGVKRSEIVLIVLAALLLIGVALMTGCTDDIGTYAASQADLADAVHQAAMEAAQ